MEPIQTFLEHEALRWSSLYIEEMSEDLWCKMIIDVLLTGIELPPCLEFMRRKYRCMRGDMCVKMKPGVLTSELHTSLYKRGIIMSRCNPYDMGDVFVPHIILYAAGIPVNAQAGIVVAQQRQIQKLRDEMDFLKESLSRVLAEESYRNIQEIIKNEPDT